MITADTLDWYELNMHAFGLLSRRAAYFGADDAEQVAQDALTRLWRALGRGVTFANDAALWAYLWDAFGSALADHRRSAQARQAQRCVSIQTIAETDSAPDDWLACLLVPAHEVDDGAAALLALIAQLAPAQRAALLATAADYRPRHLPVTCPELFPDVGAAHRALRVARLRLRAALERGDTTLRPHIIRARPRRAQEAACAAD